MKTLIMDFGGVIGSHAPRLFIREFAVKHNLDVEDVVAAFKEHFGNWIVGKITEEEFYKLFLRTLNLALPEDEFVAQCKEQFRFFITVDDGLVNQLKLIKRQHPELKLVLLSNCGKEIAEYIEEQYALLSVFDSAYYSGFAGYAKPDTKAYEYPLKSLGVKAKECIFVDDKEHNIAAAKELGFQTILFTDAQAFLKEIQPSIKEA